MTIEAGRGRGDPGDSGLEGVLSFGGQGVVELLAHFLEVDHGGSEIVLIGLDELIDTLRGRREILAGPGPGLQELVDVLGVLAEFGQAFCCRIDRLERVAD